MDLSQVAAEFTETIEAVLDFARANDHEALANLADACEGTLEGPGHIDRELEEARAR